MLTRSLLPSRQDRPWGSRLSPASRGWWGGVTAWGPPTLGDMRAGEDRAWRAKPQRGGEGHLRRQRKGMLPQNSGGGHPKTQLGGGGKLSPQNSERGCPNQLLGGMGGNHPPCPHPGRVSLRCPPLLSGGLPSHTPQNSVALPHSRGGRLSPLPLALAPTKGGGLYLPPQAPARRGRSPGVPAAGRSRRYPVRRRNRKHH